MTLPDWAHGFALVVVLSAIAALSPPPARTTDADTYERMSSVWFLPRCDYDIHCFRVLVPWIVGMVPGPSLVKWKGAAVVFEAGAAFLMRRWVLTLGASPPAATLVMWLTALGGGSLYTLFDPHTADPLMHLLGPGLMLLLFQSRIANATIVAAIGILAKEFAVVPLFVTGLQWFQQRRFAETWRVWLGGFLVIVLWLGWQTFLRQAYGYSDGGNQSFRVLSGGYLIHWVRSLSPSLVVASLLMPFGILWILWIGGLMVGRRELVQLTLAAAPCILALCYVQQPDRALWNFAFVVMPAAAMVLSCSSALLGWGLVAAHAMANLRYGAQLTFVPPAKYSLLVGSALALVAVVRATSSAERPVGSLITR
jgi:hypothetical protein